MVKEREVFYTTKEERLEAIRAAESQGETMTHDDFGQGPDGEHRLKFATLPDGDPDPNTIRLAALYQKLSLDKLTLAEVNEMLRLERGAG
tara:strand:+ start:19 stop:288 length:270 start_codon:yes stop_codon:yes gene_type:complete